MFTAALKFDIRNSFADWKQVYYKHQPIARAAGIYEVYHGHAQDNEQKVCLILGALSEDHMQKSIEAIGADIA